MGLPLIIIELKRNKAKVVIYRSDTQFFFGNQLFFLSSSCIKKKKKKWLVPNFLLFELAFREREREREREELETWLKEVKIEENQVRQPKWSQGKTVI